MFLFVAVLTVMFVFNNTFVFLRLHIHDIMMMNFDPFYVFCPRKKALHSIGLDNSMVWPLRIVVVFSLFKFCFHNFQLRSLLLLLIAS